MWVEQAFNLV